MGWMISSEFRDIKISGNQGKRQGGSMGTISLKS